MSTEFKPTANHLLTQFRGIQNNGMLMQVTNKEWSAKDGGYIVVTKNDALELGMALLDWYCDTRPVKDEPDTVKLTPHQLKIVKMIWPTTGEGE